MTGITGLPLWAFALVVAVLAPFAARALATQFERQVRERSRRLFENGSKESDVR